MIAMTTSKEILILIILVGISTYVLRYIGFHIAHKNNFSKRVISTLENIPGFMIAAILGTSFKVDTGTLIIGMGATILAYKLTDNIIIAIASGCVLVSLTRGYLNESVF